MLDSLQGAAFGKVTQTLSGKILIEAQADGVMSRYSLPQGASALQPQEVTAMLSELLDLYDRAVSSTTAQPPGGGLTGGVGANDAAIRAWMLEQLQSVYRHGVDFSYPGTRP